MMAKSNVRAGSGRTVMAGIIELALAYAPAESRAGLAGLLELDATLGRILRGAREPMLAQMRLTWWFDALEHLDRGPPPAEPVLTALAKEVLPRGVVGATLAGMIGGWEALLDDPLDEAAMRTFAAARGGRLFRAMAAVCSTADPQVETAGEGWALVDLSTNLSDPELSALARALAAERLSEVTGRRWSRAGRGLGALALAAQQELQGIAGPARVGRLIWHRMTGR